MESGAGGSWRVQVLPVYWEFFVIQYYPGEFCECILVSCPVNIIFSDILQEVFSTSESQGVKTILVNCLNVIHLSWCETLIVVLNLLPASISNKSDSAGKPQITLGANNWERSIITRSLHCPAAHSLVGLDRGWSAFYLALFSDRYSAIMFVNKEEMEASQHN